MKKLIAFAGVTVLVLTSLLTAFGFSDVTQDDFYFDAVSYLEDEGLVTGYSDGSFGYDFEINRAEMLTLVVRAKFVLEQGVGVEVDLDPADCGGTIFTDVPSDSWYAGSICYAKLSGWVGGYPDGSFDPTKEVNFVEALKISMNALGVAFDDDTDPWYLGLVNAASAKNLIPLSIDGFSKLITRGEMSDLLARILKYNAGDLDEFLGDKADYVVTFDTIEAGEDMSVLWDMPDQTGGDEYEGNTGIPCMSESDCPDPIGMGCYDQVCWDSDPCVQCPDDTVCMHDGSQGWVSIVCQDPDELDLYDHNTVEDLMWDVYDVWFGLDESEQVVEGYTDLEGNYTDLDGAIILAGGLFLTEDMAISVEYDDGDVLYLMINQSNQGGSRTNFIMKYDLIAGTNEALFEYLSDSGQKLWLWGIDPENNLAIFSLEDPTFVPSGCTSPWLDYDLYYIEIGSGDADLIPYETPQWKVDEETIQMDACMGDGQ